MFFLGIITRRWMTAALQEMVGVFRSEGVECEIIQCGAKAVADCLQCGACARLGRCVIEDDGVNMFVEKARSADAFVFASPVYYAHPSGRILSHSSATRAMRRSDSSRRHRSWSHDVAAAAPPSTP